MSATLTSRYAALMRGDDGNLHIRRYRSAQEAAAVAALRELPEAREDLKGIKSHAFARQLGVHPKTIRRMWSRGDLPGILHGPRTLLIPRLICRLARTYGLIGVARMIRQGRL